MSNLYNKFGTTISPALNYSLYTINSNGTVEGRTLLSDILALVPDSPLLQGQNGAYYLSRANHTGTQDSTSISLSPDVKSSGAYSIVAGDKGKVIEIDNALTIPTGLGAGFYCSILLNNAAAQAITTTGLTLRGTPGSSISAYGLISIIAVAADTFYIKGETE